MPAHRSRLRDVVADLLRSDARAVREATAEARARAQENLARHQTRPFASVDVTTGENVKRDEREQHG